MAKLMLLAFNVDDRLSHPPPVNVNFLQYDSVVMLHLQLMFIVLSSAYEFGKVQLHIVGVDAVLSNCGFSITLKFIYLSNPAVVTPTVYILLLFVLANKGNLPSAIESPLSPVPEVLVGVPNVVPLFVEFMNTLLEVFANM